MSEASELIAQQILNASINKKNWGQVLYNVKVFGAQGDGIYDDTQAVQDAIDTAIFNGASLVYFPPGEYAVTSLSNTSTIHFIGDNASFVGYSGLITQLGTPDPEYNVKNFGAVGDGVTDDTAAFQLAINQGGTVIIPYTSTGYVISDLIIATPIKIMCTGPKVKLIAKSGITKLFTIRSSNVMFENLTVDMVNGDASSVCFYLDTNATYLEHLYFNRLEVLKAYAAFRDANSTNIIVQLNMNEVVCRINRGIAIWFTDVYGYSFLRSVTVDNVPTFATFGMNVTFPGIRVDNVQGINFFDCDVTGGTGSTGGDGYVFNTCVAIQMTQTYADTVGGIGYKFTSCDSVSIVNATPSLCWGNDVYLDTCTHVNITNLNSNGRNGLGVGNFNPNIDGVVITGGSDIRITNPDVRFQSGNGIVLNNTERVQISTPSLFANTLRGVIESGTAASNIISNAIFGFNVVGNYSITSTFTHLTDSLLGSGSFVANQAGPSTG